MDPVDSLRVIICEDQYLQALDLAQGLRKQGVEIVGLVATAAACVEIMDAPEPRANAAVLDVELLDGSVYAIIPDLLCRGLHVVLCTGYGARDIPPRFSHLPLVEKPTDPAKIVEALKSRKVPSHAWGTAL
jgi:ActR/RegA family two-component response regulator